MIMDPIKSIQVYLEQELQIFQRRLRTAIQSDVSLLDRVMRYVLKRKGKQVRPLMVLLSAKAMGEINDVTYNGAALVEILHTATLVHDDVVDEAEKRRGFYSINALWKTKVAVLVGDYLLSRGLIMALDNKDYHSLHILSEAVKDMSEGELLQIKKSRTLDISESVYYDIIERKTASLLGAASAIGAASVCQDDHVINEFKSFGRMAGMAFQIRDDLFDYGQKDVGKPLGIDVKQKKMTLPLIRALETTSESSRKKLMSIVRSENPSNSEIKTLTQIVRDEGGLDYAYEKMLEFKDRALGHLEAVPDNEAKQSLISLTNYIVEREK